MTLAFSNRRSSISNLDLCVPVAGGLDALAAEMLEERQLRVRPWVDDPAFVLAPGERTDEIRAAWEDLRPLFWGARVPLDEGGRRVRRWILAEVPARR